MSLKPVFIMIKNLVRFKTVQEIIQRYFHPDFLKHSQIKGLFKYLNKNYLFNHLIQNVNGLGQFKWGFLHI